MTPSERLKAAIARSGLSRKEFCRAMLITERFNPNPVTLYRWLNGITPVTPAVVRWLDAHYPEETP